jgi:hypothetical protein
MPTVSSGLINRVRWLSREDKPLFSEPRSAIDRVFGFLAVKFQVLVLRMSWIPNCLRLGEKINIVKYKLYLHSNNCILRRVV